MILPKPLYISFGTESIFGISESAWSHYLLLHQKYMTIIVTPSLINRISELQKWASKWLCLWLKIYTPFEKIYTVEEKAFQLYRIIYDKLALLNETNHGDILFGGIFWRYLIQF